jgi:two-component system NtrC family response regulator
MERGLDTLGVVFRKEIIPIERGEVLRLGSGDCRLHLRQGPHGAEVCRPRGLWEPLDSRHAVRVSPYEQALLGELVQSPQAPMAVRWHGIVASHPSMLSVLERLALAAQSDAPVWLWGESGTGKERAARALHRASPRASGPFVALNCAALPESLAEAELFGVRRGAFTGADRDRKGAFERSHEGTLLLDEVGELSLCMQAKLLRVLEEMEVQPLGANCPVAINVRVVVASWADLERRSAEGSFRHDLLHRLWALRVSLPPLRQRPDDTLVLAAQFLSELGSPELLESELIRRRLVALPWSGNVRALRNACIRASVWGELKHLITPPCRGPSTRPKGMAGVKLKADRRALLDLLNSGTTSRTEAAKRLGISRSTLYRWLGEAGHLSAVHGLVPGRSCHG